MLLKIYDNKSHFLIINFFIIFLNLFKPKMNFFQPNIFWYKISNEYFLYNKNQIEKEGTPMTDQASSGRCWIFACLNVMRIPFMKKYNIDSFEFSQTYLYFWDKVI